MGCGAMLAVLCLVLAVLAEEDGSDYRGDITPDDYYDYPQYVPIHNDFQDYAVGHSVSTVCDHPSCWTVCAQQDQGEHSLVCACCPPKRPLAMPDLVLGVSCASSGAVLQYSLATAMLYDYEGMVVVLSYGQGGETMATHLVEDLSATEFSWPALCPGVQYHFCVEVRHHNMSQLDRPLCKTCTPEGPPASNPASVSVSGGLTYLEARWPPVSPQCDDLTYEVVLNKEVPEKVEEGQTVHRVEYLGPGVYNVSVRAVNSEGYSSQAIPSTLYTIQELTPPSHTRVEHKVEQGRLQAIIAWDNTFNFEQTNFTKGGYILNLYSEEGDSPTHADLASDQTEKTFYFDTFPHWNTRVSLETFLDKHTSTETELVQLFSEFTQLSTPVNVRVRNTVINNTLAAMVEWDTDTDSEGFEGLGVLVTAKTADGDGLSEVKIPHTEKSIVLTLSPDLPLDTVLSLSAYAGDTAGQQTEAVPLFAGVELTPPGNIALTHRVEDDNLTVVIEWENLVTVEGYDAGGDIFIDGMDTVLKLWDEEQNLLRSVKVPLSEHSTELILSEEVPWSTVLTLCVATETGEGASTEQYQIFSGIELTCPEDIKVEYRVAEDTLTAVVSWAHSVQHVFAGLGTAIDLFEEDDTIKTTVLNFTHNTFSVPLLSPADWGTSFSLRATAGKAAGETASQRREVFGEFLLSPPRDITVTHSLTDGDISAMVTWENTIEEMFDGLQTVLTLQIEDERVKRSENKKEQRSILLSYETTGANFSTSSLPWGTRLVLQAAVGDHRGEESDIIALFSDISLDPPEDISVTPEVVGDKVTAVIRWNTQNVFEDMTAPSVYLRFWENTTGEIKLIEEKNLSYDQNEFRTVLGDDIPWDTKFSIQTELGVRPGVESEYMNLFSAIHLSPPTVTISGNETHSEVSWNHTSQLGQFVGLGTIVTLWRGNLSILTQSLTTATSQEFLAGEGVAQDTLISLQSSVGSYHSNITDILAIFTPLAMKQTHVNTILLIVGITILLIIYILATAYCIRMLKKRGTYKLKQKHENFSPGKFSEADQLLPAGAVKAKPLSDEGSCLAEQESIVSENCLNNLVPAPSYLGESLSTLNKFNDDDDFMGNFDEDGSFIGNYEEYNQEQAQAVQNKLLVFQQMFRANGALS